MRRTLGVLAVSATLVASFAGASTADSTTGSTTGSATGSPPDARTAASGAITAFVGAFGDRLAELSSGTAPAATSPTPDLASSHSSVLFDDASLQVTDWWTVPASVDALVAELKDGTDGVAIDFPASTSSTGTGTVLISSSVTGDSTAEYTAPTMIVSLEADGTGTAVRADGFIAARDVRPDDSQITGTVQSVEVRTEGPGSSGKPVTTDQTLAGRSAEATAIVAALNAMPGVPDVQQSYPPTPCVYMPTRPTTATFDVRTADGETTVVSKGPQPCTQSTATLTQGGTSTTLDATAFQQEFPSFFGLPITAPAPTTTKANTAAAATESDTLLAAVDADLQGAGGTSDSTAPTTYLQKSQGGFGRFGDPMLRRSDWWTVPLSLDGTAAYLHDHVPAGMTDDGLGTFSDADHGVVVDSGDQESYTGPSTNAYGPGEVVVTMQAIDATHTGIRVDTSISQRAGRPAGSFVSGEVSRIHVAVTVNSLFPTKAGLKHEHRAGSFDLTGAAVERLVDRWNDLPGPELHPGVVFQPLCLLVGAPVYRVTLTFPGATGSPAVHLREAPCRGTYGTILRGGQRQGPRLEAGSFSSNIGAWVKRIG